jgi:hypothetical protein
VTTRRLKILKVSYDDLLSMLNWRVSQDGYVRLPVIEDVPKDARVVGAMDSFVDNGVLLKLEHPSFLELNPESPVPVLVAPMKARTEIVQVKRP